MSAELLREAARLMRSRAELATPGPWERARGRHGEGVRSSTTGAILATLHTDRDREDMRHVASWHPAVALAVADLLDDGASYVEFMQREHPAEPAADYAKFYLAVARAYLEETS